MPPPMKRCCPENDLASNSQTGGQNDINETSVKRYRQAGDGPWDESDSLELYVSPQGILSSGASNLSITRFCSSDIRYCTPHHKNSGSSSDLEANMSHLPLTVFTSRDFVTPGYKPTVLSPYFSYAQDIAPYLHLPAMGDCTISTELASDRGYTNDAFQPGFGGICAPMCVPDVMGIDLTNLDLSWMKDVSWDASNNVDSVDGEYPMLHWLSPLPESNCSREAQLEESNSYTGVALQGKKYREILPLPQGSLKAGLSENQSLSRETKSSKRCSSSKNLRSEGKLPLGRTGSLGTQRASEIAGMRIIKACLRCRIKKVGCTPGEICNACIKSAFGLERALCVRYTVDDSRELLFPLNFNFRKSNIENLICENVESFGGNKISVQISSGPIYPPISLLVEEFRPINEDFLALPHVKTDNDGRIESRFMRGYAPPLVVPPSSSNSLRRKCQEHVSLIAQGPRSEGELYYKHTSIVPWEIHRAIERYHRSTKDELAGKSLILYAMHFFMTQVLLFTEDSADNALRNLKHPAKFPYTRTLTSKLISLQVKHEMFNLAHELTHELLSELENKMIAAGKDRKLWASSLCTISMLCMCMEIIQVAIDFKVVHSMTKGEGEPKYFRTDSKDHCQRLDDCLMSTLEAMFHRIFKSHKHRGSRKHERGFNPIRDGVNLDDAQGLYAAEIRLVVDIRKIIAEHEKEIRLRLENPSFDTDPNDLSDLLARHLVFREKNSGRLVSRFLNSFLKYQ